MRMKLKRFLTIAMCLSSVSIVACASDSGDEAQQSACFGAGTSRTDLALAYRTILFSPTSIPLSAFIDCVCTTDALKLRDEAGRNVLMVVAATPLLGASDQYDVVARLAVVIAAGADVTATSNRGLTAEQYALEMKNMMAVGFLQRHGPQSAAAASP